MALLASGELTADQDPFSPPGQIAFSISLRDDAAAPGQTIDHMLRLTLNPGNDLTFAGGGKSVTRTKPIGSDFERIIFVEFINGTGGGGFGFNVALFTAGDLISSVDVVLQ